MSFDKRTRGNDTIDFVEEVLKHLGVEYRLDVLGTVSGYDVFGQPLPFQIRRLEVRGLVLRERMERTVDCDSDDIVEVYLYQPGKEEQLAPEIEEEPLP